jgi:hypothetical protein
VASTAVFWVHRWFSECSPSVDCHFFRGVRLAGGPAARRGGGDDDPWLLAAAAPKIAQRVVQGAV